MKSRRKKNKKPAKSRVIKKTGLQTEERYLSILKELPDIVYKIDPDGHFTFINNAIGILGYKPKDLIGKHFSELIHPDDVKLFSRHYVLPKYKGKATGDEKAPKLIDERRTGKRRTDNLEIRLIPKKRKKKSEHAAQLHIGEVIAFGDVSSAGYYTNNNKKKFLGTLGIIRDITKTKQDEKKLHYQADLLQNVTDAIISTDIDFKIRTWNKAAEKIYGWKAHEVIDKSMHKVTRAEYPEGETVKNIYKKLSEKGYWTGTATERSKDGKAIIISKSMAQIIDASGRIIGAVTVNRDITKLKHIANELKQSEEKFRHIVESAPDGIVTANKKGIITSVNTPFCQQTGYSKKQIVGKHISKMPTSRLEDIPKYIKIFNALLRGEVPKSFEFRWVHRNGTKYWGSVHVSIMKENGKVTGFQAITRDITERKEAEELWRESDRKFQALAENTPGVVCIYDLYPDGHRQLIYLGPGMEKLLGKTIADKIGNSVDYFFKLIHPEDSVTLQKAADEAEKAGKIFDHEYRVCVGPEDYVWVRSINQVKRRENGIVRWSGQVIDINQRKIAENKIKESETQFRTIFESANDVIIYVDKRGRILEVNERVENIFGYKVEDIKGKNVFRLGLFEKKNLATILKLFNSVVRKAKIKATDDKDINIMELQLRRKNGSEIFVESNTRMIEENGKLAGFLTIVRDITERKKAEEKIKESEAKWRSLVENTDDVIMIVDRLGTIRYTSTPYPPYKQKEVVGKKLYHFLPKEQHIMQRKSLERVFKTGKPDAYETSSDIPEAGIKWFSTKAVPIKSGKKVSEVILICTDITERKRADEAIRKERDRTINILDSMKDGIYIVDEHYDIEYLNPVLKKEFGSYDGKKCYTYFHHRKKVCPWCKNKDVFKGKTVRWEWYSLINKKTYDLIDTPLKNIDGSISKLEIFRDITDHKKAEEKIKASLQEKEALLKEVHHRVKNNLQIISSLLNLQARYIHDESYKKLFQESQNRIKSMVLVHEKLYQSKDLTAINVHDYVNGLLHYLCNSYGAEQNGIAIKTDIEDITLNIDTAIPCGLIINELVSNSLKHAFVEPNRDSRAEITVRLHHGRKNETVLIVSDNGVGFSDGLDFKKTESLGMQLVCALSEQLSGNIKLTRGKGTTFTITFKKGN